MSAKHYRFVAAVLIVGGAVRDSWPQSKGERVLSANPGEMSQEQIAGLDNFLRRHVETAGALTISLITGGRSNPTYAVSDGANEWILRRPPFGLVLDSAHDMSREYRVMGALAGTTVPVPRVVVACDDAEIIGAPFYIMERLEGRVIRNRSDALTLSEGERSALAEAVVRTLAALHSINPADVGLADFGRPESYLERQLLRWQAQWIAAHTQERPQVDALFEILAKNRPKTLRAGIVHGDYKIDNLLLDTVDTGSVVGLLDWEMSTLGDTMADLGFLLSFWDDSQPFNPLSQGTTALPGFPTATEIAERYATAMQLNDLSSIDWYTTFADLKLAIIFEQIHVRHLAGLTVGSGHSEMGAMVVPLLRRATDRTAAWGS